MRVFMSVPLISLMLLIGCAEPPQDSDPIVSDTPVEQTVAEPTTPPKPAVRRATIDWDAARQDFAAREIGDDTTLMVAGSSNPPVPVLLPDQPIGIASTGGSGLQFRPTADGYFAVMPGETYDLIVNGTDRLIRSGQVTAPLPEEAMMFEETLTGAQVSFRRYSASYLVEFMCKAPDTALKGSCISEAEAKQVVTDLLIAGTR